MSSPASGVGQHRPGSGGSGISQSYLSGYVPRLRSDFLEKLKMFFTKNDHNYLFKKYFDFKVETVEGKLRCAVIKVLALN